MKNLPLLIGTVLGTIVLIFGVAFFFADPSASTSNTDALTTEQQASLASGATKQLGSETAPITIVEFSDFECPACGNVEPLVQQLLKDKGDSIRFVYRHYPLQNIHPNALLAAQASEAALSFGKFWEFHHLLFTNQNEWAQITKKEELLAQFATYAENLKLDKRAFLERIETQTTLEAVKKDQELGNSVRVEATPTFFVNGRKTAAPQLSATVESLLKQQGDSTKQ